MGFFARRDLFTTIAASGVTSETYNVADYDGKFTIQLIGSPSTTTIRGSNDDGRASAIVNWSTLTTVIGSGMIEIDQGFNWLQIQRSETSNAIIGGFKRSR